MAAPKTARLATCIFPIFVSVAVFLKDTVAEDHISRSDDFDLLFRTNTQTFNNLRIPFAKPLPSWLQGTYIRNGLGRFEVGPRTLTHAFDGYAKLSSWRFHNASMYFSTRFLETNFIKASRRMDTIAPNVLFGSTSPPFSPVERVEALMHGMDNTNINVFRFGKDKFNGAVETAAVSDFWLMYRFNHTTLATIGRVDAPVPNAGLLERTGLPLPSSAHPVREHGTDNYINFVSAMNPLPFFSSTIRLVRIRSLQQREEIAKITVDRIPYMHSFGLSKNYAILFCHPMYVSLKRILLTSAASESLDWRPDEPTHLYVVDIRTGSVTMVETAAIFMMHHVNSHEVGEDQIIVDAVTYPDLGFVKSLELQTLADPVKRNTIKIDASLKRFVINLKTKVVKVLDLPLTPGAETVNRMDMPVINEAFRHRKNCFVYGVVLKADNIMLENVTLAKKNLCKPGRDQMWSRKGHIPMEPWFIARPGAKREGDGYLLSVILDTSRQRSYLGIFSAHTMRRINAGYLPTFVPYTLHGRFFPDLY